MAAVRPFLLLADSQLAALATRLTAVLHAWCADWGVDPSLVSVDCSRAWHSTQLAGENWQPVADAGAGASAAGAPAKLWRLAAAEITQQLAECMFAAERPSNATDSLAWQAAQQAGQDLSARFGQALGAAGKTGQQAGGNLLADCFAHASGALLITLHFAASRLLFLRADGSTLLNPLPQAANRPPLSKLTLAAVEKTPVVLHVEAGQAQVPLPQLMHLALGDVIRLDRSVDLPLLIRAPGGEKILAGYLARREQDMVVEVVAV